MAADAREPLDLLITGGTVVTMDGAFRVIADGAVAVRGERIVAVSTAARTLDAAGKIVMPGLIDAHAHAGHGLTKGLLEGAGGGVWLPAMERFYHHTTTRAFWYAEGLLSATERLKFGVTTGLAMPGSMPRIDDLRYAGEGVRAYEAVGIRYVLAIGPPSGPWPRTFTSWETGHPIERTVTLDEALARTEEAVQAFHGQANGRIRVAASASGLTVETSVNGGDAPSAASIRQGRELRRIADTYKVPLHMHAYGGMVAQAARGYGEIFGPDLTLAHCTGIGDDEVRILGAAGVNVAHGPLTHAFISAWCPVIELMEAGANVLITTDGSSPDRSLDLLANVHPAMQLQRVHYRDPAVLPAGKALAMVTILAARALGLADELGSLEAGKRADIVLVDARQPHLAPYADALAPVALAYFATGQDVDTVLVDGQVLMEGRRVQTVDETAVLAGAEREAFALLDRAGARAALDLPAHFWTGLRY